MTEPIYKTKEDVFAAAEKVIHHSLRQLIPESRLTSIEQKLKLYGANRKGYLGDLVEQYIFGLKINGRPEADFKIAGVELKSTPLRRHPTKKYVAKERLVFSMIDYDKVPHEKWETSSFLEKNKLLLILFYLYLEQQSILDYEFEFVYMLDLLKDIAKQDIAQIRSDWEFITAKIRRGEAHLLSEGDTYYLGACTKAKNSSVVRDQPISHIPAKPRAFSLKQTYLNYLIQKNLLGKEVEAVSIYKGEPVSKTIEEVVQDKFEKFIGMSDAQIAHKLGWQAGTRPKNYKRLLANRILTGTGSNKIEELEKANVTMRVVTLEHTGTLTESISFPAFEYKDLVTQVWYDDLSEKMSDFHAELEMNRFLFVVFQKTKGSSEVTLKKTVFWNFPMKDLGEAEKVFDRTITAIKNGDYENLPKLSESSVAHVRPHALTGEDTDVTPQGTQEIKRSFWLNAKYIQSVLGAEEEI